ncbi:ETFBKMT [Branchiostoma lanceolatum]|uniref:Electron transfer flavoprotein beta subunit lysine methyltransferase n=1 Tax=Branchiostoma lanceolatum TaxID=7740 RepID=A0A8J9YL58_BRALA|nr:ETFBKMT [Branchiostoma lanceolatum]
MNYAFTYKMYFKANLLYQRLNLLFRRCHSERRDNPSFDPIKFIQGNTEISTNHMTPEIKLHLITPRCALWDSGADQCLVSDPFWAFYWPGGQVLTRYILDHGSVVKDKSVLDVGSGCGASAIAAAMRGARRVLANDIDPVAAAAMKMNAKLNSVNLETSTDNLIGEGLHQWDVVFLGDMFYDEEFASTVSDWLKTLKQSNSSCQILIGDPGRFSLEEHPVKSLLFRVAEYELDEVCRRENNGLTLGGVWAYDPTRTMK